MGNQQPSTLIRACINATLGDGCFWKHPESLNYKIVWSSINRDWLLWKRENLLPQNLRGSMCTTRRKGTNCFPNAKDIHTLASKVDPVFTEWKAKNADDALQILDIQDMAIWYLDDGCLIHRKDSGGYRVILSVGSIGAEAIQQLTQRIFGTSKAGRVCRNNSKATERNKSWVIPKPIAIPILAAARKIAPASMQYKVVADQW